MILSRQIFTYKGNPLIEKVRIRLPYRYPAVFQNEGCFLFLKDATATVHAPTKTSAVKHSEALLLKCGTYFIDLLEQFDADTVEVFAFHLYPDVLQHLYKKELPELLVNQFRGNPKSRVVESDVLSTFIENLGFYFENPALVNPDLLELKIRELILLLVQSNNAESILHLLATLFTPTSISMVDVIQTHIYSNFTIPQLAQLCGLSTSTFKREFAKTFNKTPHKYLLDKRLKKAAELLQHSTLTVGEVAFFSGFPDPSHFSRVFKSKFNFTPTKYRTL